MNALNQKQQRLSHIRRKVFVVAAWGFTFLGSLSLSGCVGHSNDQPERAKSTKSVFTEYDATPATLNFGAVNVGSTSSQVIALSNIGTTLATITNIHVSGSGLSIQGITFPLKLNAGKSSTFNAIFAPTVPGNIAGRLSILSNAGASKIITISGTGATALAALTVSPSNLLFGNTPVGGSSSQTVVLTNSGGSNLVVSPAIVGSGFNTSNLAAPLLIAPHASSTVTVRFAPVTSGNAAGSIDFATTDPVASLNVPLTGTGATSGISIVPGNLSFGSTNIGTTNTQKISIANTGSTPLTISRASVTGTGFSLGTLAVPATLAPGQSASLSVSFAPQSPGVASGGVSVTSSASPPTNLILLSGTGASNSTGPSVSPSSLAFGNVNVGSNSNQSLTITNPGNTNLILNQATPNGTGFSLSGANFPMVIAPNGSGTLTLTFSPATAGSTTGSIALIGQPNFSAMVPLRGTGTQSGLYVSGVSVTSVSASSATITWTTSSPAGSQLYYGATPSYGSVSVPNNTLTTTHTATINGLSANTPYHFQVLSADVAGNQSQSADSVFTTGAPIGTTYYVDAVNGNDSNAGTSPTTAWKSIAKVNSRTFIRGDQVLFARSQTWREELVVPSSGAAGADITFDAYGTGSKPVLNAADLVTNWQSVSANVWSSSIGWTPNQVFRNASRMAKQTSQNSLSADNQWFSDGSNLFVFSTINPNQSTMEASRRDFAILVRDKDHVAVNNVVLQDCNSTVACYLASTTANRSDFFVSNVDVLSSFGPAIYFDNTYGAFDSITVTNVTTDHCAIIPGGTGSVAFGLQTNGPAFTNITMIGGHFAYAGVHGDASVATWDSLGVHLDKVTNSLFYGGLYDHNGSSAFGLQNNSNNVTISGGSMHDDGQASIGDGNELDFGGIGAGSSNITATGINLYGSRNAIIEIATTNMNAIMTSITVTNCLIHNGLSEGFKIGGGNTGIIFKYNQVYANASYGVFTNEGVSGSPGVSIFNNVFSGNGTGGVTTDNVYINSNGITFVNNIVANSIGQSLVKASEYYILTSDYNLFDKPGSFMAMSGVSYPLTTWQILSGQDLHSLNANPQFLNGPTADFRLSSSSPAINHGTNLGAIFSEALNPTTAFPNGPANQDTAGLNWTMGAFAY